MPNKKDFPVPKDKRTEPYWKELNKVIDPELNIGLVELGLIYDVKLKKDGTCIVVMTLTTPSCPVGPHLISEVETTMLKYKGVKTVYVEIVWDPLWNQEMIDPIIRDMLL